MTVLRIVPKETILGKVEPSIRRLPVEKRAKIVTMLWQQPWQKYREKDGMYQREPIDIDGVEYTATCQACEDCGATWPALFGIVDKVWLSVCKRTEFLCLCCFQERLSRPLRVLDFAPTPVNREFIFLLRDTLKGKY